ncbi:MAG: SET domain-containing protein-lysine N-methyltransferase [Candidatus Pacearchaeota archaeon]|jgi:hypothetical protein
MELAVRHIKGKGRGVVALRDFGLGELVEVCPIIAFFRPRNLPKELESFPYGWEGGWLAIPGGHGCLYNHSYHPNTEIENDHEQRTVVFTATKPIKRGDEVTFNYNVPLDFEVVE